MRDGGRARSALAWLITSRYLRGARSQLLNGTARSALGSTGLGVMAMVVAMALMNGYTESIQERMLESGALILMPTLVDPSDTEAGTPMDLASLPEVAAVTYAVFAQGSATSERRPQGLGVFVRGVEPGRGRFGGSSQELGRDAQGIPGALVGRELGARLEVETGELLRLVIPDLGKPNSPFRYRSVRVAGTFSAGFSEFDRRYLVMDREVVEELSSAPGLFEVAVRGSGNLDRVARRAEELFGDRYLVRDWRRSNPGLFTALRLQKWALFLVLGLIVIVSTFNVTSTLIVLVREKTRDVGVLSALGLRAAVLRRVFLACGLVLGAGGTALGLVAGSAVSWLLTRVRLLRFDPEVAEIYFIDSVPFRVHPSDLIAVAAFSLGITLLASWLPARRAAHMDPAVALRWE